MKKQIAVGKLSISKATNVERYVKETPCIVPNSFLRDMKEKTFNATYRESLLVSAPSSVASSTLKCAYFSAVR